MPLLYANEQFPLATVSALREIGHDVLTIQESGLANISLEDVEVLAYATKLNRAVLTFNRRHFIWLHERRPEHMGIIVCSFDCDFRALANRIDKALLPLASLHGQLVRVRRGV
jgi:hypothetical protein